MGEKNRADSVRARRAYTAIPSLLIDTTTLLLLLA